MRIPFVQIDAFASNPFEGNPAAVMPLAAWLDDATLQAIGAENNLAETAFIVPDESGEAEFELRWFTPATEVVLCGHATLASGHFVLSGDPSIDLVRFRTRKAGVLQVSRAGFYAWQARPPAPHARADERLGLEIAAIHVESRHRYGSPRIHAELADRGCRTSRKRVARLMRVRGLVARPRRRFRVTTQSRHPFPIAPNVLARQFERARPDQAWVTDITYIPTGEGWLYLAVILDLCSRFAVGWAMSERITDDFTLDALGMALARRRPPPGLLHHSDRGSQGGFNWSSQHLTTEVLYGKATWVDSDADRPAGDVVAGPTVGAARYGAEVLGEDRRGTVERGGGDRVWCVRPRWCSLVPRAGWHAVDPAHPAVGPVPIVR